MGIRYRNDHTVKSFGITQFLIWELYFLGLNLQEKKYVASMGSCRKGFIVTRKDFVRNAYITFPVPLRMEIQYVSTGKQFCWKGFAG